jgi:hypothetical protein
LSPLLVYRLIDSSPFSLAGFFSFCHIPAAAIASTILNTFHRALHWARVDY